MPTAGSFAFDRTTRGLSSTPNGLFIYLIEVLMFRLAPLHRAHAGGVIT